MRLRVVRIGDSPFAPVFEVVEKPNNWERMLGIRATAAEAELTGLRRRFWDRYIARHKGVFQSTRDSNVWIPMLPDSSVILSMYVGSKRSGMFLRGARGSDNEELDSIISQHAERLDQEFGASQSTKKGYCYEIWIDIAIREEDRWDELIDWMEVQRQRYAEIFGDYGT